MKRSMRFLVVATAALAVAVLALTPPVAACPFCSAPSLTLSEQLAQADAVVLVEWADAVKPEGNSPGSTTYKVRQIVKNSGDSVKKDEKITLARHRAGKAGDLFVLTGTKGTVIDWASPLEVTESSFNYMVNAPGPEVPAEKRLEYYLKFLEFPDQLVANDAYGEFANAPYENIVPLAKLMPRDRLRKWVASPDTQVTRLGLYGLMLGLCGTRDDAQLMEQKITEVSEDFRLGIDGVMGGYLLLTGEKGLDLLDAQKLQNKEVPFSETYAAMQALRFMWTYAPEKIDKDRLRQSMRGLLDRPELADLVIADLARWKDWSVQDRLMKLYGAEEYNIPSIKRAIVRYLLVSSKDVPEGGGEKEPPHVANAKKLLAELREKDPKIVQEAERFYFLK